MRALSVFWFFAVVLILSAPLWWFGTTGAKILPGLPVSGLMAFMPCLAALFVLRVAHGWFAVKQLLSKAGDYRRVSPRAWWIVLIGMMPLMLTLVFALMVATAAPLPEAPAVAAWLAPALFIGFFFAGLGEELGWMGFAFDPLRSRVGLLRASFTLAAFWTGWHVLPFFQTDRGLEWVVWHCVVTFALRVVMVWLYMRSGQSVFGIAVFHAMSNVSYYLFPNGGSHYDPRYFAPFICVAAVAAAFSMRRTYQP